MSDKDFLEIFDKINDKFLVETYRDNEKRRRGSKRMFFHAAYTAAACIMVVAAAVLIVSSFIGRDEFIHPSSGAGESMSSNSLPESGDPSDDSLSDSESSAVEPAPRIPVYEDAVVVEMVRFEFPDSGIPLNESEVPAFYADFQQQSVSARLGLKVYFTNAYTGDNGTIPMRMYLFSDGRQSLFQYDKANIPYLDLDVDPESETEIEFSFYAGRSTNSVAVVCVFFPGDAARQDCFICSASNFGASEGYGSIDRIRVEEFVLEDGINEMTDRNILTLSGTQIYGPDIDRLYRQILLDAQTTANGNPVKTVPVDSACMYMHCSSEIFEFGSSYHLIALIDGELAPVFDGEFFTTVEQYDNDLFLYYKLPSEYLSENSTIQLIALPVFTYQLNWWGMQSECCLLTE
ncbi:MAG: hypothetical protein K2N38_02885 [Oscillospiraceae bacterium]|nr:hypothetical protein [Oscillospiraceae bacterium]